MPTSDYTDEEVEEVCDIIAGIMDSKGRRANAIILGDWNRIVGEERDRKEVGLYGLGTRNERRKKMVEFCRRRKMIIIKNGSKIMSEEHTPGKGQETQQDSKLITF